MSRWTLASYNRFLGASITANGFTRKEAATHYRTMRSALDRPAFRSDLKKHPRIAARTARVTMEHRLPPIRPARIRPEELPPLEEREEEKEEEIEGSEETDYGE